MAVPVSGWRGNRKRRPFIERGTRRHEAPAWRSRVLRPASRSAVTGRGGRHRTGHEAPAYRARGRRGYLDRRAAGAVTERGGRHTTGQEGARGPLPTGRGAIMGP